MANLIRTLIGAVLAALTFGQLGATPLAVLVLAFLVTVVWSPLTRQEVS
jgi:hypothetical protein